MEVIAQLAPTFSAQLRRRREALGVSREELAVASGASGTTIKNYELGKAQQGAERQIGQIEAGIPADPGHEKAPR